MCGYQCWANLAHLTIYICKLDSKTCLNSLGTCMFFFSVRLSIHFLRWYFFQKHYYFVFPLLNVCNFTESSNYNKFFPTVIAVNEAKHTEFEGFRVHTKHTYILLFNYIDSKICLHFFWTLIFVLHCVCLTTLIHSVNNGTLKFSRCL